MPKEVLKKYWGYAEFRPLQEDIITEILGGRDVLAILPTGAGKSICFQVPVMMKEGLAIVVSPLVSLMQDQVKNLKSRGINAVAIHSGLSKKEIDITLDNCIYGDVKFLYLSPERLKTEIFQERASRMNINLLAIDEAHCISQWGYDFRPPYLEIGVFRKQLENVPCVAFTASATEKVKKDIVKRLELKEPEVFVSTFARDNISYSVFSPENKELRLMEIINKVPGTAIVYASTRKKVKDITQRFLQKGVSADYYHAGLTQKDREQRQQLWTEGRVRVIVATNAFGMGIDKPDVRSVIHYDLPSSIEAYYQEAGRAGRDGKKSYAVLLYDQNDIDRLNIHTKLSYPSIDEIKRVYQSLANYYQVAVGAGYLQSFDFIIEDFSKRYELDVLKTYQILKILQRSGILQLSEEFSNPSKLHMLLENKEMYKFQVANPQYDGLIKMILRSYGGELYSDFVRISEEKIAKTLSIEVAVLTKHLIALHKLGVLTYIQRNELPQITFLIPRVDTGSLQIDSDDLKKRKRIEEKRVKSMIEYAENKALCRMAHISLYFGEDLDNCGKCDVCLKRKDQSSEIRKQIILVAKDQMLLSDLIQEIPGFSSDEVIAVLRRMVDEGYYAIDEEVIKVKV